MELSRSWELKMANYRQIHTQIWRDNWFLDLEPDEKLMFIYLFSNDSTNLAGLYEIHERVIQLETGLDKARIEEILKRFEREGKVHYQDGVVWMVNMKKYHSNAGEKVQKNIDSMVMGIHDCELKQKYCIANGIDLENTLSENSDTLSYNKSKRESKSKNESKRESESNPPEGATCPSSTDQRIVSICDHLKTAGLEITHTTEQTIKALILVYKVPDIHDAIDHMAAHTDRPNTAYLKKVLDGWYDERKIQKVYS